MCTKSGAIELLDFKPISIAMQGEKDETLTLYPKMQYLTPTALSLRPKDKMSRGQRTAQKSAGEFPKLQQQGLYAYKTRANVMCIHCVYKLITMSHIGFVDIENTNSSNRQLPVQRLGGPAFRR